ncbi:MAG TPA: ribose-phosphate diphosphokinase [Rhizomicrobium sp.]|nr:ribose-phosphate diphosphokinase [Rhizomicrobium sp.]
MRPLFAALPGNDAMAAKLCEAAGGDLCAIEARAFPDGETYLRLAGEIEGRSLALVCTLARPNDKILPLLFAADAARDLGARRIGLVAPYLAYMRQDRRFRPGEAVTSRPFATLVSGAFDWLVAVDPHLHRYSSLGDIYDIPARALHAGALLARWIAANVDDPFIVGPDEESAQWVAEVAQDSGCAFAVLRKQRLGDREVTIAARDLERIGDKTPVLIDDIVSSGETMIAAIAAVARASSRAPVCLAVHGIFADEAVARIEATGARVVSTNTAPNARGAIDVAPLLAPAIIDLAGREPGP